MLPGVLVVVAGCSFNEMIAQPAYTESALYSLCDYGRPITVGNLGIYDSRTGRGEILLAAQLSQQPVESLLGFGAFIIPLKFVGDGWAWFRPQGPAELESTSQVAGIRVRECDGLTGSYLVTGTSVRLDGSVEARGAEAQFFRPEITAEPTQPGRSAAEALRVAHTTDERVDELT